MTIKYVSFINLILAALLAGTSFGIWLGFNPQHYSPSTYIEQQQNLVNSLNTLLVSMVIITTLFTLLSAYLQRGNRYLFITLLIAATFFAACILISRFGNLPIQTEILKWDVSSIPDDWEVLRDEWWNYHIYRTIAELIALVLITWTVIEHSSKQLSRP